eukprot:NODE_782_length_4275_cov_0.249042.p2 type:complete len:236 gc:universal NODE_782_length_4275_cov_0.249042:389-1096(+)
MLFLYLAIAELLDGAQRRTEVCVRIPENCKPQYDDGRVSPEDAYCNGHNSCCKTHSKSAILKKLTLLASLPILSGGLAYSTYKYGKLCFLDIGDYSREHNEASLHCNWTLRCKDKDMGQNSNIFDSTSGEVITPSKLPENCELVNIGYQKYDLKACKDLNDKIVKKRQKVDRDFKSMVALAFCSIITCMGCVLGSFCAFGKKEILEDISLDNNPEETSQRCDFAGIPRKNPENLV